jgi:serine/threonine-protein kinase
MGEVWEGRDRVIGRRVAIKLLAHDRRDVAGAELFQREARTAGALSHPGVVTVHDFGQDKADGSLFLVMEFLDGRDLDTVLREDGPPRVTVAVDWVAQAAAALAVAHEVNVVHRDLKPANLILASEATSAEQVKILDFGIARFMESLPSSRVMGTFPYMPPERFAEHPGNARSDLYSLGCVLHELLTGRVPFQATSPASMMSAHLTRTPEPPSRLRAEVPGALDDLVRELLAKDPEDRPASAVEVRDRLRGLPAVAVSRTGAKGAKGAKGAEGAKGAGMGAAVRFANTHTRTAEADARGNAGGAADAAGAADGQPPTRSEFLTRRRALWFGVAATVGAGATVGFGLLRNSGDFGNGSPSSTGPRPWFTAAHSLLSSLVEGRGVVYVNGRTTDYGTVYALDGATGAEKWSYRIKGGGHGKPTADLDAAASIPTPVLAEGAVYADGLDGNLYVLDAATGARKWAYTVGGVRLLTAANGVVLVYVHHEDAIHALDAATGTERWAARRIGGIKSWETADKVVHTYIDDQGNVKALDVATGTKKWDLEGRYAQELWTADGMVLTSGSTDSAGIYALDAATGTQRWQFPVSSTWAVEVGGGAAYFVGTLDLKVAVQALDARTGKRKWSAPPEANNLGGSSLRAARGALYVNGSTLTHALNASTGRTKWSIDTADHDNLVMEVGAGVVYVGETTADPHVQALDAATGNRRWTSAVAGSDLLIAPTVLYVTSKSKDTVYALDVATGASRVPWG